VERILKVDPTGIFPVKLICVIVCIRRSRESMADERVVDEIVTKFVLNTCRLSPQLRRHVDAVVYCAAAACMHVEDDVDAELIPLLTGSVAEFYIEPML